MTEYNSSNRKTVARHSAVYIAGELVSKGIAFFLIPLYVAYLSPEDYGIIESLRVLLNLLMLILTFGFPSAIVRFYYDRSSQEQYRRFLGSVVVFALLGAGITCAVLDVFKSQVFAGLMPQVPLYPHMQLTIWTAFFTVLGQLMSSYYRARQKPGIAVAIDITRAILLAIGAVVFLVLLKRGAIGKLEGDIAAYAVYTVACLFFFMAVAKPAMDFPRIRAALSFGLPLIPVSLALWVMSFTDRIILQQYRPISEVGIYSLGYNLAIILALLSTAIARAWQPHFYDSANRGVQNKVTPGLAYTYVAVVCFLGLSIVAFSGQVVSIVASREYQSAASIVPTVVFGYIFFSFYIVLAFQVAFAKRNALLTYITLVCGVLNVILNLALVPSFGMHGSALSTVITFAALCVMSYIAAQRVFPITYSTSRILLLFASSGALALLFVLINPTGFLHQTLLGLAILGLFPIIALLLRPKAVRAAASSGS